jgi:Lrp/AsnC family leucine-responsive transcriptional regulator
MIDDLDPIDFTICKILSGNARITMKELGIKIFRAEETARAHVKKLEDLGYILGYEIILDSSKFERIVLTHHNIKLVSNAGGNLSRFIEKAKLVPNVKNCLHVAARDYDFIVIVQTPSLLQNYQVMFELCESFEIFSISNAVILSETRSKKKNNFLSTLKQDFNKLFIFLPYFISVINKELNFFGELS